MTSVSQFCLSRQQQANNCKRKQLFNLLPDVQEQLEGVSTRDQWSEYVLQTRHQQNTSQTITQVACAQMTQLFSDSRKQPTNSWIHGPDCTQNCVLALV